MNLKELKTLLAAHPASGIMLVLPDGGLVPAHFHITEVGHMLKRFIDCGGGVHRHESCLLQAWVADDTEHRITAGKLAGIIELFSRLNHDDSLPVEIEYEEDLVSQFPLVGVTLDGDTLRLHLELRHTDCLAKEACGVAPTEDGCCAGSNCC